MKRLMIVWLWCMMTSLAQAAEKTLSLPVDLQAGGNVIDTNQDGIFDTVKTGENQGMEWHIGRGFLGPVVTVMEFKLPENWQGKTIKVLDASLNLSANGKYGTHPDNKPELATDCVLYIYTGKQADGKITVEDVQDEHGKTVGTEAGLFIESQTPLKAGRIFTSDVTEILQKVIEEKSPAVGFRLVSKTLPDSIAYWRWRSPIFAQKYGKNYAPALKIKVLVD